MTEETRGRGGDPLEPTLREPPPASETRRENASHEGGQTSDPAGFPQELREHYRVVGSLPRGGQAQTWVVEDLVSKDEVVLKVYDRSFEPKKNLLDLLATLPPDRTAHLVSLLKHDQLSDGRRYEVQEYLPNGTLRDLIEDGHTKSAPAVRAVLKQLADALAYLHERGIEHQDLKPPNVLVRSLVPLDLVLGDFGTASVVDMSKRGTELSAKSSLYAPPEAFAGYRGRVVLWREKYDWWAVGMMVVEMLTGRHPLPSDILQIAHELGTRNLDALAEDVKNDEWRMLCRGLLRRDPAKRWGLKQVRTWLRDPRDSELHVADEGSPSQSVFDFVGRGYESLQDLAAAFAADRSNARRVWKKRQDELVTWVVDKQGASEVGKQLVKIDCTYGLNLNAQLFLMIRALDPGQQSFEGVELTLDRIAELSRQAAADPDGKPGQVLRDLHSSRVLSIANSYGPILTLKNAPAVAKAWSDALAAYKSLREKRETGGLPLTSAEQTLLLAAATPRSGVTEILRGRANNALTKYSLAREVDWFQTLGTVENADAPALLAMTYLAERAHAQRREERREEERRAEETRREARVADMKCVGRGTAVGVGLALLWLGVVGGAVWSSQSVSSMAVAGAVVALCGVAFGFATSAGNRTWVGVCAIGLTFLWAVFRQPLDGWADQLRASLGGSWTPVLLLVFLGLPTLAILCTGLFRAQSHMPMPWTWRAVVAGALATFAVWTAATDQPLSEANVRTLASEVSGTEEEQRQLALSPLRWRRIQEGLAAKGFLNPRQVDGIFGPVTRAAIGSWQKELGAMPTGYVNEGAVDAILRLRPLPPPRVQSPRVRSPRPALRVTIPMKPCVPSEAVLVFRCRSSKCIHVKPCSAWRRS